MIIISSHQNLKLKQSSTERKIESPCESFWFHGQSRGGSFPELLCQRSEDILSVTSFITSELMNLGVVALICFLQAALRGNICGSSAVTLRTFIVVLGFPLCYFFHPCLYTH